MAMRGTMFYMGKNVLDRVFHRALVTCMQRGIFVYGRGGCLYCLYMYSVCASRKLMKYMKKKENMHGSNCFFFETSKAFVLNFWDSKNLPPSPPQPT